MNVSYRNFKKNLYRQMKKELSISTSSSDFLLAGLQSGEKVLDLGCGTGNLLQKAAAVVGETGECWGVDISGDMLEMAREKLSFLNNIKLKQVDISLGLPYAEQNFDLVCACDLLQEIPSVSFLAEEVYRILKKGGTFRSVIPCLLEENQDSRIFALLSRKYFLYLHTKQELEEIFCHSQFTEKRTLFYLKGADFSNFFTYVWQLESFSNLLQDFE